MRSTVNHHRTKILAASLLLAVLSPAASASDGTITFTGRITTNTCTISGNGGGTDFTVALPPVSASTLATAGNIAGRTPFNFQLTGCTPATADVAVYFEPGAAVDLATGRLINTTVSAPATDDSPGITAATNVQIGVLNADLTNVAVGAAFASQNTQQVAITGGTASLQYYAQYVATGGAATAGVFTSALTYSVVYP